MNSLRDFAAELQRLSTKIDEGVQALARAADDFAHADSDYRKAKALAFLAAEAKTVAEKEAIVDRECEEPRLRQRIAEGKRMAAHEALRARRQQCSAWQSLLAAWKADVELSRYGPEVGP